jgi:hypothetical protein
LTGAKRRSNSSSSGGGGGQNIRVTRCFGGGSGVIFSTIAAIGPSRIAQVAPSSAHCCQ